MMIKNLRILSIILSALYLNLTVVDSSWAQDLGKEITTKETIAENKKAPVDPMLKAVGLDGSDVTVVKKTGSFNNFFNAQITNKKENMENEASKRSGVAYNGDSNKYKTDEWKQSEEGKKWKAAYDEVVYEESQKAQAAFIRGNIELNTYKKLSGCGDNHNACLLAVDKLKHKTDLSSSEKDLLEKIKVAGEAAVKEAAGSPYFGLSSVTLQDKYGNQYEMEIKNGVPQDVLYGEKEEAMNFKGCEALPVKLYKQKKCFFCPLFAVIYKAADRMAVTSYEKLATSFATILALGLAIWIAVQTLTHVSSLTKQDAPKFLGNLLKQSFKFLIAFLILTYMDDLYNRLIVPLLDAGLTFGKSLLMNQEPVQAIGKAEDLTAKEALGVATQFYTPTLYAALEAFISSVQSEIAFMQAIGSTLLCIGSNKMIGVGGIDFGNGFQMAVQGLVLAAFGFLLSLAFAFYLIDAIVQLGIVGALMPFLVACWPFKLTAQYTSKGFSMILNSFFVFIFTGLVVSVNLALIDSALSVNEQKEVISVQATGTNAAADESGQKETKTGALAKIFDAINAQNQEKLQELTDISGTGFLILLFCCIFGFKFSSQGVALADKMASGGIKGIAPSIATMGASAATSAAKKVTAPVREAVWDKTEKAAGALLQSPVTVPMAIYNRIRGGSRKNGSDNKEPDKIGGGGGASSDANPTTLVASTKEGNPKLANAQSDLKKDNKAVLGNAPEETPGTLAGGDVSSAANNTAPAAVPYANGELQPESADHQKRRQAYLDRVESGKIDRNRGKGGSKGGSQGMNGKLANKGKRR